MFKVLDKKLMLIPFIVLAFHISILSIAIVINHTVFGIVAIIVSILLLALVYVYLYRWLVLTENRVVELSKDIAGARQYVIDDLPLGVILLNDDEEISWLNQFMSEEIPEDFHHEPINRVFPNIMTTLKANNIQTIDTSTATRTIRFTIIRSIMLFCSSILPKRKRCRSSLKIKTRLSEFCSLITMMI
jgi:Predicted signaling protein consisting of a modified GGDEF domain and a DHH domain